MASSDIGSVGSGTFARIQQMIAQREASTGRKMSADEMSGILEPMFSAQAGAQVSMEAQNIQKSLEQQRQAQQLGEFQASQAQQQSQFEQTAATQEQQYQDQLAAAKTGGMIQVGSTLAQLGILGKSLGVFGAKTAGTTSATGIGTAGAGATGTGVADLSAINLPGASSVGSPLSTAGTEVTATDVTSSTASTAATTGTDLSWLSGGGYLVGAALFAGGVQNYQAGRSNEGLIMEGAGIGAAIGTFILPGVGTLIGAGIGAGVGATAALARKAYGKFEERGGITNVGGGSLEFWR